MGPAAPARCTPSRRTQPRDRRRARRGDRGGVPVLSSRPLAVFDIDGVIADVSHRLHHLAQRPKAWEEFFTAAVADPPLSPGLALARELAADHDVVWLTGRPERTRALTEAWLIENGLPPTPLYMRGDHDRRPGRAAKIDILRVLSRYHTIGVVVDDDPSVVEAVRAEGLPVRLADWLPYREPLRHAQQDDGRT